MDRLVSHQDLSRVEEQLEQSQQKVGWLIEQNSRLIEQVQRLSAVSPDEGEKSVGNTPTIKQRKKPGVKRFHENEWVQEQICYAGVPADDELFLEWQSLRCLQVQGYEGATYRKERKAFAKAVRKQPSRTREEWVKAPDYWYELIFDLESRGDDEETWNLMMYYWRKVMKKWRGESDEEGDE